IRARNVTGVQTCALPIYPKDKKMTLVSLPRDTEVAVYGYEDYFPSKINSAYEYGGSATAVKTVQKFLNVPIDFYATINMSGLKRSEERRVGKECRRGRCT